jgi:hypothetical protein
MAARSIKPQFITLQHVVKLLLGAIVALHRRAGNTRLVRAIHNVNDSVGVLVVVMPQVTNLPEQQEAEKTK